MTDTALETPDLPEDDNDPEALLKLRNAVTVLVKENADAEAAAKQAYSQVMQERSIFLARARAIAYDILADVLAAGFTHDDIARAFGPELGGVL